MGTATSFVGRDRAASLWCAAVREAHEGRGSLLLVAGDAGIGKTALVSHVAAQAESVVARTAWGRAIEGLASPSYWLWTQVLRQLGILAVGEHVGAASAPGNGDPGDDRFRLFEQVVAALEDASRGGGLLVVLDDLHWADADSLALLELVGRSLEARRIVVIGTYRDTEPRDALAGWVTSPQVLPVEGLSDGATGELMRDLLGHEVTHAEVSRMHRRTGGNPFFVRELTRLSQLRNEAGQPGDTVDVVDSVAGGDRTSPGAAVPALCPPVDRRRDRWIRPPAVGPAEVLDEGYDHQRAAG